MVLSNINWLCSTYVQQVLYLQRGKVGAQSPGGWLKMWRLYSAYLQPASPIRFLTVLFAGGLLTILKACPVCKSLVAQEEAVSAISALGHSRFNTQS